MEKILVIDDDPGKRFVVSKKLSSAGYQVVAGTSGYECLELAVIEKPDIIIIDVMMPGIDGIETLKRLKKNDATKDLYVVLSSAFKFSPEEQAVGLAAGAFDYIMQPIQTNELLARMHIFLQHKKTLDELRATKEMFENIFSTSPNAAIITRLADGIIIDINEEFSELTGHIREEIIGKSILEINNFITPSDTKILTDKLFAAGACKNFEVMSPGEDSSLAVYILDARIMTIKGIPHIITIVRDVTRRKLVEKELAENRLRLREVLENSLVASYKRNLKTHDYDYFSPVLKRILGYSPDEFRALPLETVLNLMHPDDIAEVNRVITDALSASIGTAHQLEYRFKHKDGKYRWLLDQFTVIPDADGNPAALIGSISDISDRKLAEAKLVESETLYKRLANNSLDVIWTMDLSGKFTYISPSVEKLRGFTVDEIMQQSFEEVISPGSRELVAKLIKERIASAYNGIYMPAPAVEVEQPCKDGTSVWTEVVSDLMYNESGTAVGIIGVTRNISERKKVQDALSESNARLRRAEIIAKLGSACTRKDKI